MDTLGKPLLLFEMQNMRQRESRIKTSGERLGVLSHLFPTDLGENVSPVILGSLVYFRFVFFFLDSSVVFVLLNSVK